MNTTTTAPATIYLPARNRTNKDGSADKRYNIGAATEVHMVLVFEDGKDFAEVEVTTPRRAEFTAIARLAIHLGIPLSEAQERFTAVRV